MSIELIACSIIRHGDVLEDFNAISASESIEMHFLKRSTGILPQSKSIFNNKIP